MHKRLVRFLLISAAVSAVLVLAAFVLVFNSSFQTWAVRRALAGQPGIAIGHVDAGFSSVELRAVEVTRNSVHLSAPVIRARIPVIPLLWSRRVSISRLEARDWSVELENPGKADAVARDPESGPADAVSGFTGVFNSLQLPCDVAIDSVDLAGIARLKGSPFSAHVTVTGGNLGVGRDARFDVRSETLVEGDSATTVLVEGQLTARMDTARTFRRVGAALRATATGARLPSHVTVAGDITAVRDARAETYTIELSGGQRRLVSILAEFPVAAKAINGTWKLDVRDTDVTPFVPGRVLPTFAATGEGKLDADVAFTAVHATGRFDAAVDRLGVLWPELAVVGAARLTADIDVARRGDVLSISRLNVAALSGSKPVATVRSLQAFEFNASSGQLVPTDAARELLGIVLEGVPLAWAKPFTPDLAVNGEDLRGELVATPRASGFTFKTKTPLTIGGLSVSRRGAPLLQALDVSLTTSGDYTPQGWQVELAAVSSRSGGRPVLMLDSRAGRLAGTEQAVKATGLLSLDLGALSAQPVARNVVALTRGDATVEFAASLGETRKIDAKVAIKNIVAGSASAPVNLPAVTGGVRADYSADGSWTIHAPISLQREGRESDLSLYGTLTPRSKGAAFDAQLTSKSLSVDDVRAFAAAVPAITSTAAGEPSQASTPAWAGLDGSVTLNLASVRYSEKLEVRNVTGKLRLSGGTVNVEDVRGGVGEGTATVSGALSFDATADRPYSASADLELTDFDPGPLFLIVNPRQQPTVEGRFTVSTHLRSRAARVAQLPSRAYGEFDLRSRSGTFRGMTVNVGNLVENSSKLMSWLASAGNAITSIGRKDPSQSDVDEIRNRSQAASELAKSLSSIAYDQLNVVVVRDEALTTSVKEFTLISPEYRIAGSGTARFVPGRSIINEAVALDLQLKARGRPGELMKFLGVLEGRPDDLGYTGCTIPVTVGGTLASVDNSDLSNRLVALAVQKTGLTEKAVDWISRLRGK